MSAEKKNLHRKLVIFMTLSICLFAFSASVIPVSATTTTSKNMENRLIVNDWGDKICWDLHLLLSVTVEGGYIISDSWDWVFEDGPYGAWQIDTSYGGAGNWVTRQEDGTGQIYTLLEVKQKIIRTDVSSYVILGAWIKITSGGTVTYGTYYWEHNIIWWMNPRLTILVTNWV